jgi:phosphoribosylformylglycinamidine synthase
MSQVKVCVLFGFGINCDRETAAVFDMVGGTSERVHVNRLVQGERSLSEFDILAVPGGFLIWRSSWQWPPSRKQIAFCTT